MSLKAFATAGALACILSGAQLAAQPGTPSRPNMPAPAGLPDHAMQDDRDTVGTAGQNNDVDQGNLPDTASPLGLIALGGLAAVGGAAALRRSRQ